MFNGYFLDITSAQYEDKILIIDTINLRAKVDYMDILRKNGFELVFYANDLQLRLDLESCKNAEKIAILAQPKDYIPYDIKQRYFSFEIKYESLFPRLNAEALINYKGLNFDMLAMAYRDDFDDHYELDQSLSFIEERVYSRSNIVKYVDTIFEALNEDILKAKSIKDWFAIARKKAIADVEGAKVNYNGDASSCNNKFKEYFLAKYGSLTMEIATKGPVLVKNAMEFMHDHSNKFVVIVMDGMSLFDWWILRDSFADLQFEEGYSCAMLPTTTSISRQCLLSNKFPSELEEPWKQSKEKAEFIKCAQDMGCDRLQIDYQRGYDVTFDTQIKCGAVIINDIDDMVHAQFDGREGMLEDVGKLANRSKLLHLVKKMLDEEFDVYITADHGNTPCIGIGKLKNTGIETETKSRRMLVLKDFADKQVYLDKYGMIELEKKTFLPKAFDYLLCAEGQSFDDKGYQVMSHGGMTIDEVIVPFITFKAVDNNG